MYERTTDSFEQFTDRALRRKTLQRIEQANEIIAEYVAQGYTLTVRQIYYQFVARNLIENTQSNYQKVRHALSEGRLNGMTPWGAIEDRTRNVKSLQHWRSIKQLLNESAEGFNFDLWADQPRRVEVWIEKQALAGVIEGICNENDVPFFACLGYVSLSEQYHAAQRALSWHADTLILHLADHDPSGIDMTRDNKASFERFGLGAAVELKRIALNMDQVEELHLPPNPAKFSDPRSTGYAKEYGKKSWELDALPPQYLVRLIESELNAAIDHDLMDTAREQQQQARAQLRELADQFER